LLAFTFVAIMTSWYSILGVY